MIPISWIRSKTDMAIVFVTPIPPTISASSEKIQPASMIKPARRVDLDHLARLGDRGHAREALLDALRHVRRTTAELDGDAEVVTSPGRCASFWTTCSGSTAPMSSKRLPEW